MFHLLLLVISSEHLRSALVVVLVAVENRESDRAGGISRLANETALIRRDINKDLQLDEQSEH